MKRMHGDTSSARRQPSSALKFSAAEARACVCALCKHNGKCGEIVPSKYISKHFITIIVGGSGGRRMHKMVCASNGRCDVCPTCSRWADDRRIEWIRELDAFVQNGFYGLLSPFSSAALREFANSPELVRFGRIKVHIRSAVRTSSHSFRSFSDDGHCVSYHYYFHLSIMCSCISVSYAIVVAIILCVHFSSGPGESAWFECMFIKWCTMRGTRCMRCVRLFAYRMHRNRSSIMINRISMELFEFVIWQSSK